MAIGPQPTEPSTRRTTPLRSQFAADSISSRFASFYLGISRLFAVAIHRVHSIRCFVAVPLCLPAMVGLLARASLPIRLANLSIRAQYLRQKFAGVRLRISSHLFRSSSGYYFSTL